MAETMTGNQFTRKLGPLPVWGWAALLLVAWFVYRHFQATSGTQPVDVGGNPADTGTYIPPRSQGGATGGVYNTPSGGPGDPMPDPDPDPSKRRGGGGSRGGGNNVPYDVSHGFRPPAPGPRS